jgi:hypothetical protein
MTKNYRQATAARFLLCCEPGDGEIALFFRFIFCAHEPVREFLERRGKIV